MKCRRTREQHGSDHRSEPHRRSWHRKPAKRTPARRTRRLHPSTPRTIEQRVLGAVMTHPQGAIQDDVLARWNRWATSTARSPRVSAAC
jgi:hypothetical protein